MSLMLQLEKETPEAPIHTRETQNVPVVAGAMVTERRMHNGAFRARVCVALQEEQQRIKESARNREELLKATRLLHFSRGDIDDDDDSPVLPRKLPHPDNAIMNCWQMDDSDSEGDGNVFIPPVGKPFRVVEAPFFIPPIQHASCNAFVSGLPGESSRAPKMSVCERIHRDSNHSVQQLLVMCIGLTETEGGTERQLANFEEDSVYTKYLEKSFVPKVPQLKAEMMQQAEEQGIKRLRKNSVLKPEAIAWLKEHPVTDLASVNYLLKTEKALYKTMLEMAVESEASELAKLATANWNGPKPWLRLYLCATDDRAIEALKVKNDCMDRDKLSARNHADRPETHDEVVARLYNDESFIPSTEALPDLHVTFSEEIELPFYTMPGGRITAELVKSKMSDARVKLLQVSFYCGEMSLLASSKLTQDCWRDVTYYFNRLLRNGKRADPVPARGHRRMQSLVVMIRK